MCACKVDKDGRGIGEGFISVNESGDCTAGIDGKEFFRVVLLVEEVNFYLLEVDVEDGGEQADFVAVAGFVVGIEFGCHCDQFSTCILVTEWKMCFQKLRK